MHDRRPDAIEPRPPVRRPWHRERRPAELLRVQPQWRPLRRVLPDRQRAGDRLGGALVAEARHVRQWHGGRLYRKRFAETGAATFRMLEAWKASSNCE